MTPFTLANATALRNAGQTLVVATTAGRDYLFPSPVQDLCVYNIQTKALERYNGGWETLAVLTFSDLTVFGDVTADTLIVGGDPDSGTTAPLKWTGLAAWDGDLRPINDKDNNLGSLTKRLLGAFITALGISNAAGNNRYITFYTDSSARWQEGASSTAESGGNAGSDRRWVALDDSGVSLGTYMSLNRATGLLTVTNNVSAKRYIGSGTAHVAGDYAASANWGTGPTITPTARDTGGRVSVLAQATTGANPTLALTFKNGTWTTVPAVVCSRGDTNATAGYWVLSSITATVATFTFVGTPVAGETYILDFHATGK